MNAAAPHSPQAIPVRASIETASPMPIAGCSCLTDALVNAYYARDIEALRRIAAHVEFRMSAMALALQRQDAS